MCEDTTVRHAETQAKTTSYPLLLVSGLEATKGNVIMIRFPALAVKKIHKKS